MEHMTLGERIRSLREGAGMSLEGLVRELERHGYTVTPKGVQKWETGEAIPAITYCAGLARVFGVTLDALAGIDPQMTQMGADVGDDARGQA